MNMTLLQAAKAAGTLGMLGEQILPGRMAKAVFDNRKELQPQVEFLESEERKLIAEYGAVFLENGRLSVKDDPEKNAEFCRRMDELHKIDVEIHPVIVDADELLDRASIKPKDIENISYLFAADEKEEGEKKA